MKTIKKLACLAFVIGMVLIFGAVGTDDFYVMEMNQIHALNWWKFVAGIACCIPLPIINEWWG